jgi:hypothetical protein
MTQATDDPTPIPTSLNVTALAKAHGVNRRTIQRRLKRGWTPPAAPAVAKGRGERRDKPTATPHPLPQSMPHEMPQLVTPAVTEGSRIAGALLAATALVLAGVGLATNAQFAASLGQTRAAATLLAALGVAIDGLALILPCVAGVLWRGRHRLASVTAWSVWTGAVTVTLIAAAGPNGSRRWHSEPAKA